MDKISQKYAEIMQQRCAEQTADISNLRAEVKRLNEERAFLLAEVARLKAPKVIVKMERKQHVERR